MELFTQVKKTLKDREIAILSLEKKLNSANSLSRTLLEALTKAIGWGDVLSSSEKQAIKQETADLCEQIDFQVNGLNRAVELE
jgi:hypothetical protein|tara:strand:+ start:616 stop:864 length:249 start_codon:yes stop_codon:yes gene_type:complete